VPRSGKPQHQHHEAITIRTTAGQASRLLDFDPAKSERPVEVTIGVEEARSLLAAFQSHPDKAREIDRSIADIGRALAALEESSPTVPARGRGRPLTPREREVLRALSRGDSYAEIARDLHLDVETVRSHARSLRRKLGVASSRELRGWLDPWLVI
jgi:DNA-binding NarL/FixJ family response regulator